MRSSLLNDLVVIFSYTEKRETYANGRGFYLNVAAIILERDFENRFLDKFHGY